MELAGEQKNMTPRRTTQHVNLQRKVSLGYGYEDCLPPPGHPGLIWRVSNRHETDRQTVPNFPRLIFCSKSSQRFGRDAVGGVELASAFRQRRRIAQCRCGSEGCTQRSKRLAGVLLCAECCLLCRCRVPGCRNAKKTPHRAAHTLLASLAQVSRFSLFRWNSAIGKVRRRATCASELALLVSKLPGTERVHPGAAAPAQHSIGNHARVTHSPFLAPRPQSQSHI